MSPRDAASLAPDVMPTKRDVPRYAPALSREKGAQRAHGNGTIRARGNPSSSDRDISPGMSSGPPRAKRDTSTRGSGTPGLPSKKRYRSDWGFKAR